MEPYKNLKINKEKNGVIEITGEVPVETFEKHIKKAVEEIQKDFEAPGFRKGNVPKKIIEEKVDNNHLLGDASKKALQEAYEAVLENNDFNIMSAPRANITKMARGNPLEFKIQVAVVPNIKLPDYKKIAREVVKKIEDSDVSTSDEEVENTIKQILAMNADEKTNKVPELNDELVKSLGKFDNVKDFKEKVRKNLGLEKKMLEIKKRREKIAEKLLEKTEIPVADLAVETELGFAVERLEAMLKGSDITLEEYVKNSGKKLEDLLEEEKKYIIRQLKSQIMFSKIAEKEGVEIEDEEIEEEMNRIVMQHPESAKNPEALKKYAERLIKNEKVLKILEGKDKEDES